MNETIRVAFALASLQIPDSQGVRNSKGHQQWLLMARINDLELESPWCPTHSASYFPLLAGMRPPQRSRLDRRAQLPIVSRAGEQGSATGGHLGNLHFRQFDSSANQSTSPNYQRISRTSEHRTITHKKVLDTSSLGSQHADLNISSHALRMALSPAPEKAA